MSKKILFLFLTLFIFNSCLFGEKLGYISSEQLNKIGLIYGDEGKKRLLRFNKMLLNAQNKNRLTQLKIVNSFFNRLKYKEDKSHWKEKDYWASPYEFIGSGAGDCEDYAIAKYYALKLLGIKSEKLQISYAMMRESNSKKTTLHVVLKYFHNPNSTAVVLDNLNNKIELATKRDDIKLYQNIDIVQVMTLQKLFWS